jgi:uncharacterized protein YggU (UPF0235/DUF167 family)
VRLTPGASRDEVSGLARASDGSAHLAARVRAVPEKGAANAALERLVAAWLGVPRSAVSVDAGARSRLKTVTVTGDSDRLAARVAELLGL